MQSKVNRQCEYKFDLHLCSKLTRLLKMVDKLVDAEQFRVDTSHSKYKRRHRVTYHVRLQHSKYLLVLSIFLNKR